MKLTEARTAFLWQTTAFAIAVGLVACNDTTTPSATTLADGAAEFDAQIDPAGSSFVLKRFETALPGHAPVRVDLIGSNLEINSSAKTVSIQVALHNGGDQALHVPAIIWLHRFDPATVRPTNADVERGGDSDSTSLASIPAWGFDYSEFLGGDAVLEPGETSTHKLWEFSDPNLLPFAFGAQARFGTQPDRPQIAGAVFLDRNRNARRERDEEPFSGVVTLTTPDHQALVARTNDDGRYRFPIEVAGLYRLQYASILRDGDPQPDPRALVCVTTPNPLEVLVLPGPENQPMSFERADFGVMFGPCSVVPAIPGLVLTERQPADIGQDPYDLLGAGLEGDILTLHVGISGCSPDHPFVLHAGRGFMESNPVQTWALLAHDDRGEPCDAYFERRLQFDLAALRAEHIRAYGRPGIVVLRFHDFRGEETRFEFGP